jgi:cysteine desulfurase/selenocysteine lyase
VYLDNAATTQKPKVVIQALTQYYEKTNSNVHRGVHYLSEKATLQYENVREQVKLFINAFTPEEIIFTKGTTDSINLLASSYGRKFLKAGDEILITAMEHHSNIVPWQLICEQTGAKLKVAAMNKSGELDVESFKSQLSSKTKMVSVVHMSNALGTVNPVEELTSLAHNAGAVVHLDCAQSISHIGLDVQKIGCDFVSFSGHKIYGPTGVGVFWGRRSLLEKMPPYQGGGDMIKTVTFEKTEFADLPNKFEAGTPNIEGVIGLGVAIDYVNSIGLQNIAEHEASLLARATSEIKKIEGIRVLADIDSKASVLSFVMEGVHPHDIGTIVDQEGVAIRTGHHCAQPVMDFFDVPATCRASFGLYNDDEDIDLLIAALKKVRKVFKK